MVNLRTTISLLFIKFPQVHISNLTIQHNACQSQMCLHGRLVGLEDKHARET